jgi:hypothetical protein
MDWKSKINQIEEEIDYSAIKEASEVSGFIQKKIENIIYSFKDDIIKSAFKEKFGIDQSDMYDNKYSEERVSEMENFVYDSRRELEKELKEFVEEKILGSLIDDYRECVYNYMEKK